MIDDARVDNWRSDPRLTEIDALCRAGRTSEAIERARIVSATGFEHPLILNLLAYDAQQRSRLDDAIGFVRRALEISPGEPSLLLSLGNHLSAAGALGEALEAFDAVLVAAPDYPLAVCGRAKTLLRAGRYAEAEPLFSTILSTDPTSVDALVGLAALARQRGEYVVARAYAEKALDIESENHEVAFVLAEIDNAEGLYREAEGRLRDLMARPSAATLDPGMVSLHLGDALHGQARFADAFESYVTGKHEQQVFHATPVLAGVGERYADRAARLARYFRNADPHVWCSPNAAPLVDRLPKHAFVVGFPRSGTTLLEQILATHADVAVLEEVATLSKTITEYFANDIGLDRLATIEKQDAEAHRSAHFDIISSVIGPTGDKCVIEKLPIYSLFLPAIKKLFPNARIILAVRDPRDVVFSCFRRRFVMNPSNFEFTDLIWTAKYYNNVMSAVAQYRNVLDLDLMILRNEDLIGDFDKCSKNLCQFVGLEWSESLRDFAASARRRDIRTPSANQVRRGINADGVGQWRCYERELEPVMAILDPWIRQFGYELPR